MIGRDETTDDKDPLAVAFEAAIRSESADDMALVAAAYRERAAYAEGRLDGHEDGTYYLRRLAMILDPRRDEAGAFRFGMFVARAVDAAEPEADGQAEPAEAPAPGAPA